MSQSVQTPSSEVHSQHAWRLVTDLKLTIISSPGSLVHIFGNSHNVSTRRH